LRRENLALTYGDFHIVSTTDKQWVYKRKYFGNEVIIAFNKSSEEVTIPIGRIKGEVNTNFSSQLKGGESGRYSYLTPLLF
jgi:glycosidase